MTSQANDLVDALINTPESYFSKLDNYCDLALSQELTDDEADKLAAIYTEAEYDPLLNFFITELDRILAERQTLLDDRAIEQYKNQQAWLREHLEQTLFDQTHRVEIQEILQRQGLYHGPLDGIWGKRSSQALTQFRKRVQQRLQEQGFYDGKIDGVFGERSVTAVMQFQRSRDLVDDGVAGKKTLSALQLECQL